MDIFGLHFHNWQDIKQWETYDFRGHKCTKLYPTKYKICSECLEMREYFFDSQGGSWGKVSDCERKILDDSIYIENGGWYLRNSNNDSS
jgi:hypothetical protein